MTPWATLQYLETVEPVGDAFTDWEAYASAWENQAAKLMPVEYQEEYKMRYWLPGSPTSGFFMQISTPVFAVDGTAVTGQAIALQNTGQNQAQLSQSTGS